MMQTDWRTIQAACTNKKHDKWNWMVQWLLARQFCITLSKQYCIKVFHVLIMIVCQMTTHCNIYYIYYNTTGPEFTGSLCGRTKCFTCHLFYLGLAAAAQLLQTTNQSWRPNSVPICWSMRSGWDGVAIKYHPQWSSYNKYDSVVDFHMTNSQQLTAVHMVVASGWSRTLTVSLFAGI